MSKFSYGLSDRYPAQLIIAMADLGFVVFSGFIVYRLRFGDFYLHERYVLAVSVISLFVLLLNSLFGSYSRWRVTRITTLVARLFMVWVFVGLLATSIIFFAHAADRFSRLWVVGTLSLSLLLACCARATVQLMLKKYRIKGKARRSVFLIGPGHQLIKVAKGMRSSPGEGYSIAGVERVSNENDRYLVDRIVRRVISSGAKEIWICLPLELGGVVRTISYALRNHTGELRFLPDLQGMQLLNHSVSEVAGHYSIDLSVSPLNGMARVVKRSEDLLVALFALIIILPICLAIAIAVKLSSPGPALFKQYRTGANGKKFKVYKFRTMKFHEESDGVVSQAKKGDDRITPVGRFLRRTSLDELPQFYNVVQGRMSIVGPRPHALAHNEYYKDIVESYMRRHKVKPGITGWAQVNGFRGETDTLGKMQSRVEHDLWYIDNWSVWLDIKIIILTAFKIFSDKNAY
ncbi:undecaprenyl-phosphate glucose phosphotransferase [Halomonas sp. H33-56]|uniref:undecaprenyl-phosphate glucose phosphotransferase n=1 Tax=Halomonas sp. H33-56 TaxID=2950873 RepID=UPI0032DFFE12